MSEITNRNYSAISGLDLFASSNCLVRTAHLTSLRSSSLSLRRDGIRDVSTKVVTIGQDVTPEIIPREKSRRTKKRERAFGAHANCPAVSSAVVCRLFFSLFTREGRIFSYADAENSVELCGTAERAPRGVAAEDRATKSGHVSINWLDAESA